MTWCWIIPVLVGAVCALLGYLLGRSGRKRLVEAWSEKWEATRKDLENANRKLSLAINDLDKAKESEQKATAGYDELIGRFNLLQREWDNNRTAIQNLKDENNALKISLGMLQPPDTDDQPEFESPGPIQDQDISIESGHVSDGAVFDPEKARQIMEKPVVENDLTIIEGIGLAIRDLFHENGITTWYQLSQCNVEQCEAILRSGGDRFRNHHPGTWPRQAFLAFQGNWEQLKLWQDELDGGIEQRE